MAKVDMGKEVQDMKFAERLYCRCFQRAFWLALPILPYRNPVRVDHLAELPRLLRGKRIRSVLLVTDRGIRKAGLTRQLEKALGRSHIRCVVYDGTVANPTTDNVEEGRRRYRLGGCQAIIGFGGGSAMDCAKAVGARVAKPNQSLAQMEGILKVHKRIPLLVAVPTTAGTGSETTLAAVITDGHTRHKYPINDFSLIPDYAVLDPAVTRSLPPGLTATTGMDALTHAVEAYIGHSVTGETKAQAERAVYLIFKYLEAAYLDGRDMRARRNMLYAAYLAGCAFTKSYVGYVHAVAHTLGGRYNVPHGLANAVLLPHVLRGYGHTADRKLHRLAIVIGISNRNEGHAAGAEKFITAVERLRQKLSIPDTIPALRREDIPELAHEAAHEGNPLYPVPKLMDAGELEQFYYAVLEEHK